jgi:hypothetical protein
MGFGEAARPTPYERDAAELSSEGEEPCRSRWLRGAGEFIMHPGVGSGPGGGDANRVGANPIAETWLDGINRRRVGTPEARFEDREVPSLPASALDIGRTDKPTSWWRLMRALRRAVARRLQRLVGRWRETHARSARPLLDH